MRSGARAAAVGQARAGDAGPVLVAWPRSLPDNLRHAATAYQTAIDDLIHDAGLAA